VVEGGEVVRLRDEGKDTSYDTILCGNLDTTKYDERESGHRQLLRSSIGTDREGGYEPAESEGEAKTKTMTKPKK